VVRLKMVQSTGARVAAQRYRRVSREKAEDERCPGKRRLEVHEKETSTKRRGAKKKEWFLCKGGTKGKVCLSSKSTVRGTALKYEIHRGKKGWKEKS